MACLRLQARVANRDGQSSRGLRADYAKTGKTGSWTTSSLPKNYQLHQLNADDRMYNEYFQWNWTSSPLSSCTRCCTMAVPRMKSTRTSTIPRLTHITYVQTSMSDNAADIIFEYLNDEDAKRMIMII